MGGFFSYIWAGAPTHRSQKGSDACVGSRVRLIMGLMGGDPKLTIHVRTDDYAIASFGPILLQLWQRSTPLEGARAARRFAFELAGAGFERTGSLVIVPENSAIPDKEARAELTNIPIDLENGAGLVLVQEGTGFRASAVRAVLSTMMLLSRRTMPHDVVPTVSAGSSWLTKRVKVPGGAMALTTATSELRSIYRDALSSGLAAVTDPHG